MDLRPMPKPLTHVPLATASSGGRGSLFEGLLVLIVICLLFWFLVLPKQQQVGAAKDRLEQLKTERAAFEQNRKTTDRLVAELSSKTAQVSQLDEALPLDARTSKVRFALESLASSLNVTVASLDVSSKAETVVSGNRALSDKPFSVTRKLETLTVSMEVLATMDQFQGFLEKLETSGRVFDINGLEILNSKDDRLLFRLNLSTYYYGAT